MHKRINLNFSKCMKWEMFLAASIILFTIAKQGTLVSLCFSMSFIVLLGYSLHRATTTGYSLNLVLLIIVSFVNVTVNALTSSEAILCFGYFKKLLMFVSFMLMLNFAQNDDITRKAYNIIFKLPCVMAIILVCSFFAGNTTRYAGGITLGFSNPNFTGMWLMHLFVYVFLLAYSTRNRTKRLALGIALVIMLWLIYETKARSCLIGLFVFFLLYIMGRLTNDNFAKRPVVWGTVNLFPIAFALLYQSLLNAKWFIDTFSFLVSEGKGLNSRASVWTPAMRAFSGSPISGDYCGISQGTGLSQLHNMHLDVLVSYGIVPFILFLVALFELSRRITDHKMSGFNYIAFCGFLAVIIEGTFEAGVVSGAMGLNILTAGLIMLANYESEE